MLWKRFQTMPSHGVGIALGMLVENAIALQKGMLSKTAFQRIAVLAHALVPETAWKIFSGLGAEALLPLLRNDKKVVGSTLKLALLQDIGHIVFADLPLDERGTKTVRNAIHEVLEMRS